MFFDRSDLPAAHEYDQAIARGIEQSDLLVFLITPDSVAPGRYTLTELKLAEKNWPHPSGRVLPVLLRPTDRDIIPPYLRAVGILEPHGDVVAEVAHEVRSIARSRNIVRRVLRAVATPLGLTLALAGAVAVLAVAQPWQSDVPGDESAASDSSHTLLFRDDAQRRRVRGVASTVEGFVVAMANPPELVRFADDGAPVAEPMPLRGQPVAMLRAGYQLLVATEAPDGVIVLDTRDWSLVNDAPLDPSSVPGADTLDVSGDIRSITVFDGEVWAVTGDRDGEPTLLRLRVGRLWSPVSWANPPEFGDFDTRQLLLRTVAGQLWGVTAGTSPASLYRIVGNVNVQTFDGGSIGMIACATDVTGSADGNLLLLDCDNRLLELQANGRLALLNAHATLPPEHGPGRWTSEIIVRDGGAVFIALSTRITQPDDRPAHARIARVDPGGVVPMLDMQDAVITSMAVTPQLIIAIVRRADGSVDAISLRRTA